ncbi:MAG TPA: MFS transporter [Actinospica sp.]|nr:MFS transporter [Actinospica sp.]
MTDSPQTPSPRPGRAALAAWIGSALEYYDFFIYGSASALIFAKVFFNPKDPGTAEVLSLLSFGVAYAARPVGAFILGHIGDRFGRRRIMVGTVIAMGLSTFLIGCLPTYSQVGGLASVLLVTLRVLQGLSAAGEQASANSLTLENSPANRRGFFTSFTLCGTQFGQIIATLVFIPVASMPEHQLLTWGWRIPFLASALVTVAGYVIRRKTEETPVFQQAVADGSVSRVPLLDLLRHDWANVLRVTCAAMIASVSTIFTVWALSYASGKDVGLGKSMMLWVGVVANAVALAAIPLWARLSDRIGRRPVFIFGAVGSAVAMYFYLEAISTRNHALVFVMGAVAFGVVYSAANGVWPSLYGEMFSTRVRLSGMAIGTQIGFAIAGFATTAAAGITGKNGWLGLKGPGGVAVFLSVLCAISALAALSARETAHVPTEELGRARPAADEPAALRSPVPPPAGRPA